MQNYCKNGKLDGECKTWYRNGQIEFQEFYKDDMRDGDTKCWWPNGQLEYHDVYSQGILHGECKSWDRNGHLKFRRFYRDGRCEGEWKEWNELGEMYTCFYLDGCNVNINFNIFKKHKWLRGLRKWKSKANLQSIGPVLDELNIPLDLVKICAQYK